MIRREGEWWMQSITPRVRKRHRDGYISLVRNNLNTHFGVRQTAKPCSRRVHFPARS